MGLQNDIRTIESSGLADKEWYLVRYKDVEIIGLGAVEHYLRIGASLLRDPGPNFSTAYYLSLHVDVAKDGTNPLLHYIRHGRAEGRSAAASGTRLPIDSATNDNATDPLATLIPALRCLDSDKIARIKNLFDTEFYLSQNSDVSLSGFDPFVHYMMKGWKEGRDPAPFFSTKYYIEKAPDVRKAGINPFVHYVLHGIGEKRPAVPFRARLSMVDYQPKVSVIVPNYNHGQFLGQRIESILAQTYENLDVLVLDDCSNDNSRDVITEFCEKYPGRVRSLFNDRNSGNVFRQWRKGVENSDGDLIWICESDDFCEPDFLEILVRNFKDRSVNIAFGRIQFSDRDGRFKSGLDNYREGAEPGIWADPTVRPASLWFASGFGVNNVIANVGGCVMRRQSLLQSVWEEAETYSILGDWFLYCHLAGGGQIAYEPTAIAYFRQHGGNTSVTSFTKPSYYDEHQRLMILLKQRWDVPEATVDKFIGKVSFQYSHFKLQEKFGSFDRHVNREKLLAEARQVPHILIAFLGFHPGGGELFPINLANALHGKGCLVSMLALDMQHVNPDMLAGLDAAIPVYDAGYVEEMGADAFLCSAGISLVHSHMVSLEAFFFEKCAIQATIPYLVTLHGSYEACGITDERLSRFASRVTHWAYTTHKNLEPFKAISLPATSVSRFANGMPVDDRPFPKTREELGIASDAVVFTLVARGILRKGWRAAITAFRRLRDRNPDRKVHLLLCGDGPEMARHADEHQADPDITFLGYQSRIDGLYRISDCAIAPTRFAGESFPLCLIQALQTGTPVIATDVGEIRGMVVQSDSVAGVVLEPIRDTEAFIEGLEIAMVTMLDPSARRRFSSAARENGRCFDITKVAEDYIRLYQTLIAESLNSS